MDGNHGSTPTIRLSRKMDYLSALFYNKERVSKFIREMDQFKAKDIMKLKTLIDDLAGDMRYYFSKKEKDKKISLSNMRKIDKEIKDSDMFRDREAYIELLVKKKAEVMRLAGMSGLLPDYVEGMTKYER